MSQEPPTSETPSPTPTQGGHRLGIGHLLLWTAATSVVAAVIAPGLTQQDIPESEPEVIAHTETVSDDDSTIVTHTTTIIRPARIALREGVMAVLFAPLAGAGLAALALAAWRYWKEGPPFPTQPGHWLLVNVGTIAAVVLGNMLLDRAIEAASRPNLWEAGMLVLAISLLIAGGVYFYSVAWVQDPPRWKVAFRVPLWSCGLLFLFLWLGFGANTPGWQLSLVELGVLCGYMSGVVGMAVAAVQDLRLGKEYDVFHWTGVTVSLILALLIVVFVFQPMWQS